MAVAGFAAWEYFVTPFFGAWTALLMFLLLSDFAGRYWAWVFTTLWVFSPLVVSASTYVMSDIVATFFILLSLFLVRKRWLFSAGLAFGFSLMVRPSNLLFAVLLLPMALKRNRWLRFPIGTGIPAALYAAYNWYQYGAPWKTGYPTTGMDLTTSVFSHHFLFYLKETAIQFTPLLIVLALVALCRWKRTGFFFITWFLILLVFYSFWRPGGDVWWYLRFMLPGIPALFFLASKGAAEIETLVGERGVRPAPIARSVITVAALLVLVFLFHFAADKIIYKTGKGRMFFDVSRAVADVVPPHSMVGSLGYSGPLRLYGGMESFCLYHVNSAPLVRYLMKREVPVFIIVQPFGWDHPQIKRILKRYGSERVMTFYDKDDFCLLRLKPPEG
jgi:hypothetical protein